MPKGQQTTLDRIGLLPVDTKCINAGRFFFWSNLHQFWPETADDVLQTTHSDFFLCQSHNFSFLINNLYDVFCRQMDRKMKCLYYELVHDLIKNSISLVLG